VTSINALEGARKATIEGRVSSSRSARWRTAACSSHDRRRHRLIDGHVLNGRTHIPGFEPGVRPPPRRKVSMRGGGPAMINPAYELLAKDGEPGAGTTPR